MVKRIRASAWTKAFQRSAKKMARSALQAGVRATAKATEQAIHSAIDRQRPPKGDGDWIAGMAIGLKGVRRFRLYRPPDVKSGERLALMVMLHGCGQDAKSFAVGTRMNRIAARERFLVLYPEQDRLANAQGCWNWFDTAGGRAHIEAALIMKAIDQVCLLYQVDPARIAITGLSAGASMAALLVTRHPERFKALVMHSGVPPGTAHSSMSALGAMYGHRATRPLEATSPSGGLSRPPLLVIHGGADHIVSASNGQAAVEVWAEAAGAQAGKKRTVQRGHRHPMTVTDFKCKGRTVATLVEVDKLGHAWSGGAAKQPYCDQKGPDASRMAWAFAAKQFIKS
jgi:poly(hydroxyalkanoate) depolymerase family esterase